MGRNTIKDKDGKIIGVIDEETGITEFYVQRPKKKTKRKTKGELEVGKDEGTS